MPETPLSEPAVASPAKSIFSRGLVRLAGGSALFFLGRLAGAALAYVTQVALANWMGGVEYGRYASAFATCTVLTTICILGFRDASLRIIGLELANEDQGKALGFMRRGRHIVVGAGTVVGLIGAAALWARAHFTGTPPHWPLITSFLAIPAFGLLRLQSGHAHAFRRFALTVLPNTVVRPAIFLIVITVFWLTGLEFKAGVAMATHVGVMVLVLGGQSLILRSTLRPELADATPEYDTRAWVRVSAPLLVVSLASTFYSEVNVMLLGMFRPPEDVAVYQAAWRTAFFIGLGIIAIDSLILPSISRMHAEGDQQKIRRLVAQSALLRFWGAVIGLVVLAVWGRQLLEVFGEGFGRGYPVLLALGFAQLVRAGFGPVAELLNVTGRQDASMWVATVGLVSTAILFVIFVPKHGLEGASAIVIAMTVITSLASHEIVRRSLGIETSILGRRS